MKKKEEEDKSVAAAQWKERGRPVWRTFPGPPGASAALRVSLSRAAYGEITSHGKESLEGEVCGVLAGELAEDDDGVFVDVQVSVRGTGARAGRGHVTFTQETWNGIHQTLEKDHPKLQIVGWYHTHPGFGVEFSEMDVFIQRNFFSLPTQVALVMDPLGGDVALAMNGNSGIQYVDRFWVDGREHRAKVPAPRTDASQAGAVERGPDSLQALENRVSQLAGALHELRASQNRFMLFAGLFIAISLTFLIGYGVYRSMVSRLRPPEGLSYIPVPVMIEGKPVVIGIGVVKWQIPDELIFQPPERENPPSPESTAPPPRQEKTR